MLVIYHDLLDTQQASDKDGVDVTKEFVHLKDKFSS